MLTDQLVLVADIAAHVVLYLLIGLSVVSIGIIVERWLYFRRRRVDLARLGRSLEQKLTDVAAATRSLRGERAVECQVLAEALGWYDAGPEPFSAIVEQKLRERRREIEGAQVFLGTLGNNAPFIGLFGTVLGVVTAFHQLGSSAAQAGEMATVMNGIAEALIATALGILVALPAVIAYNVFQKRAAEVEENALALRSLVVAHMLARGVRG